MSLSIDQIRQYDRGGSIAISNDAGDGPAQIEKTGFGHWLCSIFGITRSVAKNEHTVAALRAAIQNDPRYFAADVQQRAAELLANVKVGSSIAVAKVKGIIAELDSMSTPTLQSQAVRNAAIGHLAAAGLPQVAAGMEDVYKRTAVTFAARLAEGGTYAGIDVAARLAEFQEIIGGTIGRLGDNPDVKELFLAFANAGRLCGADGQLKSAEELAAFADGIRQTVAELDEIGKRHGEQIRANVLDGLKKIATPLPAGTVSALVNGGAAMPKCGLDKLNGDSSATDIHRAVAKFFKSRTDDLKRLTSAKNEPIVSSWLMRFIGMGAAASLTAEGKKALLDAFKSEQGGNLLSFYVCNMAGDGRFQQDIGDFASGLLMQLNAEVDKTPPNAMIDFPEEYDVEMLPANAIFDIDPKEAVSGDAAKKIVDGLLKAGNSPVKGLDDPELKNRMNTIAKDSLTVNFAQQVNEIRQTQGKKKAGKPDFGQINENFRTDLRRGFAITVTINGRQVKLPNEDVAKSRDILAQFLAQDEKAAFAELDDIAKAKVYMLTSCLHQGIVAAVQAGVSLAFSPEKNGNPLYSGGGSDVAFALSLNGNKDVEIDMSARLYKSPSKASPFMVTKQLADGVPDVFLCGKNDHFDYCAKITMPTADMDKFIKADWENYDYTKVKETSIRQDIPHYKEKAVGLIPEKYRFLCDVDVAFHLHAENATQMNESISPTSRHSKK